MHWFNSLAVVASFGLAACDSSTPEQQDTNTQNMSLNVIAQPDEAAVNNGPTAKAPISTRDRARACRAAIADLNGRSPSIVKVVSDDGEIVRVRYKRPDDGKVWTSDCRFDGTTVMWRAVDAFGPGSGTRRWRDNPADEKITFSIDGSKVTITTTYPDGSGGSESYTMR